MHLVEQPEEELLRIVLLRTAKLCAVPVDHRLEADGRAPAVGLQLVARPQRLEHLRQLLGQLALGAELARRQLVAALQVGLVAVQHEVLGQDVGVAEALQHGVHEARVAMVLQAGDAGYLVRRPALQVAGGQRAGRHALAEQRRRGREQRVRLLGLRDADDECVECDNND